MCSPPSVPKEYFFSSTSLSASHRRWRTEAGRQCRQSEHHSFVPGHLPRQKAVVRPVFSPPLWKYPVLGYFATRSILYVVKPNNYSRRYEYLRTLLLALRKEAGLRQIELAARLGCPQSFVSKYESGQRRLDLIELDAICEALGIPLDEFIERFRKG
ncbi:helix-turn-helix transcriptional regulator [Solidesulfovibrio sp.]|nr:helix-turn-helix transcriptional regulator [Solidesulfovibrio sp.]MEA4856006.1 helix-turn-helix transcriptional regulator [Solidesulfovibrio sp.]